MIERKPFTPEQVLEIIKIEIQEKVDNKQVPALALRYDLFRKYTRKALRPGLAHLVRNSFVYMGDTLNDYYFKPIE